jgi:hypothetical protein
MHNIFATTNLAITGGGFDRTSAGLIDCTTKSSDLSGQEAVDWQEFVNLSYWEIIALGTDYRHLFWCNSVRLAGDKSKATEKNKENHVPVLNQVIQ